MDVQQPSANHTPKITADNARKALAEIDTLPLAQTKPSTPLWAIIIGSLLFGITVAFFTLYKLYPFAIGFAGIIVLFTCIALSNRRPGIRTAIRQPYDRKEFQTTGERAIEILAFGWIVFLFAVRDISTLLGRPWWFAVLAGVVAAIHMAVWLHAMNKQYDRARTHWMTISAHSIGSSEQGRGDKKGRAES